MGALESLGLPDDAPEIDTLDLVREFRDGDEAAARRLVRRLYPLVIKIVRAHRARRTDEQDLAQMVFVRVFARLDQWRASAPFEHWVSRVAVNVCLTQIEYQRVRPEWRMADLGDDQLEWLDRTASEPHPDTPAGTAAETASADLGARELVEKLMQAVAPRDRLVLQLLDLEGRSVEEASQITGWSRTMVKVQAFRARRRMRKLLTRLLREPTP